MKSSPSYPGQFKRAVFAKGYAAGRWALNASDDGEESHNLGLRIGQVLEHTPRLCAKLLGDPNFDKWVQGHDLSFNIGNVNMEMPYITGAGSIKRHDQNPNLVFHQLPIGAKTIGGMTPEYRPGNEGKRLHVDEANRSIVNFMGLNNSGVELWAAQLEYERDVLGVKHIPLIANIANDPLTKPTDKPAEAKKMAKRIGPFIHVIEYNASCPNVGTASGAAAFSGESLESLVATLKAIHEGLREAGRENVPVLLKLPPHLDYAAMERVIHATHDFVTGYTCINTSPDPELKKQTPVGENKGGLSGKFILPEMLRTVQLVRDIAPETTIIALGGLGTGKTRKERFEQGYNAIKSGANLVSSYSGLVFNPYSMHDVIAGAITALNEKKK